MKYCRKCFRNVDEENMSCPYCGNNNLEVYGSTQSGEKFECSKVEKDIRPKIVADENYKEDEEVVNPYSDERLFKGSVFEILDDMERGSDTTEVKKDFCVCLEDEKDYSGTLKKDVKSMSKEERDKLLAEKRKQSKQNLQESDNKNIAIGQDALFEKRRKLREELMERGEYTPQQIEVIVKNVLPGKQNEQTVINNRNISDVGVEKKAKNLKAAFLVCFILAFISPAFGIIATIILLTLNMKNKNNI